MSLLARSDPELLSDPEYEKPWPVSIMLASSAGAHITSFRGLLAWDWATELAGGHQTFGGCQLSVSTNADLHYPIPIQTLFDIIGVAV